MSARTFAMTAVCMALTLASAAHSHDHAHPASHPQSTDAQQSGIQSHTQNSHANHTGYPQPAGAQHSEDQSHTRNRHANHTMEAPLSDCAQHSMQMPPANRAQHAMQVRPADHTQRAGQSAPSADGHQDDSQHADHSMHQPPGAGPVLPPITDADRAAAFPDLPGHAVHDRAIRSFVLFEKLEWQDAEDDDALTWEANGWIGGDLDRLWFRIEGERVDSHTESAEAHLLWGRHISRWWDIVAGARQDFEPGPAQTWAAFGIQGLAPYFFELEATAYLGEGGQTAARLEAEYEMLLTNRLILQPLIELEMYGRNDSRRGIGSGFSAAEAGLRLRYEIRREIAPYIGLTWERKLGNTADLAELEGEDPSDTRFIAGLRIWF